MPDEITVYPGLNIIVISDDGSGKSPMKKVKLEKYEAWASENARKKFEEDCAETVDVKTVLEEVGKRTGISFDHFEKVDPFFTMGPVLEMLKYNDESLKKTCELWIQSWNADSADIKVTPDELLAAIKCCHSEERDRLMAACVANGSKTVAQKIVDVRKLTDEDVETFMKEIEEVEWTENDITCERDLPLADTEANFLEWTSNLHGYPLGTMLSAEDGVTPLPMMTSETGMAKHALRMCKDLYEELKMYEEASTTDEFKPSEARYMSFFMGDEENGGAFIEAKKGKPCLADLAEALNKAARLRAYNIYDFSNKLGWKHSRINPETTGVPFMILNVELRDFDHWNFCLTVGFFFKDKAPNDLIQSYIRHQIRNTLKYDPPEKGDIPYKPYTTWDDESTANALFTTIIRFCEIANQTTLIKKNQVNTDQKPCPYTRPVTRPLPEQAQEQDTTHRQKVTRRSR